MVEKSSDRVLQIVVSVLVGLALAFVAGVGTRVLYARPRLSGPTLAELDAQQKALDSSVNLAGGKMVGSHAAVYQRVTQEIAAKKQAIESTTGTWTRNTMIVLIALGLVLMGLALVPPARLALFADGAFLGGLFTLAYGVVWLFTQRGPGLWPFSGVALAGAVVLGWLRFLVHGRLRGPARVGASRSAA